MKTTARTIFVSAATHEFADARRRLADKLRRPGVNVILQENLADSGGFTLATLHDTITRCDAVIHLVGGSSGSAPSRSKVDLFLSEHPEIASALPKLSNLIQNGRLPSYTHWEAYIAAGTNVPLHVFSWDCSDNTPADASILLQDEHFTLLKGIPHRNIHPVAICSPHHLVEEVLHRVHDIIPQRTNTPHNIRVHELGSLFKGRNGELDKLKDVLLSADPGRVVVIHAQGGYGKTRLAAEFALTQIERFTAVFFVHGESPEAVEKGIGDIVGVLAIPEMNRGSPESNEQRVAAAIAWLKHNRDWLLILDNIDAESTRKRVRDILLEVQHAGKTIITSRIASSWPRGFVSLELGVLPLCAATDYLLETTGSPPFSAEKRAQATQLADTLGGLALALVQASAYIDRRKMSIPSYLKAWDSNRIRLLDDPSFNPDSTGYPRTIATTWFTTYERLPAAAQRLFDLLCWLGPQPIPQWLFTAPFPNEEGLSGTPQKLDQTFADELREGAFLPLLDYSIVTGVVDESSTFTLHPLAQDVGRIWQGGASTAEKRHETAIRWLLAHLDRDLSIANMRKQVLPAVRELLPHAAATVSRPVRAGTPLALKAARLAAITADYFRVDRNSANARTLSLRALFLCPERTERDRESVEQWRVRTMATDCFLTQAINASEPIGSEWQDRLAACLEPPEPPLAEEDLSILASLRLTHCSWLRAQCAYEEASSHVTGLHRDLQAGLKAYSRNGVLTLQLAQVCSEKARIHDLLWEWTEEKHSLDEGSRFLEELDRAHPDNLTLLTSRLVHIDRVVKFRRNREELATALDICERQQLPLARRIVELDCASPQSRLNLAICLNSMGRLYAATGDTAAAAAHFHEACDLCLNLDCPLDNAILHWLCDSADEFDKLDQAQHPDVAPTDLTAKVRSFLERPNWTAEERGLIAPWLKTLDSWSQATANETANQLTPEEVYAFFKDMSANKLADLARQAVAFLREAKTRQEAEHRVIKMAPFFLDCTFHRLPEMLKERLGTVLDEAEERFGSLSEVLGLDEIEDDEPANATPELERTTPPEEPTISTKDTQAAIDPSSAIHSDSSQDEELNSDQIYQFFAQLPVSKLEELAREAIDALGGASSRDEAETNVVKMAPFFLNCTMPRLPEPVQAALRLTLDQAEERFGSLAGVLGLDENADGETEENHQESPSPEGDKPADHDDPTKNEPQ